MARRNKKRVNGLSFPAPFAVGVLVISCLALVYVWLGGRCEALGKDLKVLENEKKELSKKHLAEEYRWARVKAPANVEQTLARLGITMGWPRRDQVIRLSERDMRFDSRIPEVAQGGSRLRNDQRSL